MLLPILKVINNDFDGCEKIIEKASKGRHAIIGIISVYFKKLFYAPELQDMQVEIDHANVIIIYEQCSIDYWEKIKRGNC